MNNKLTPKQRRHLAVIKEMECGVCGHPPPSDCHHVEQHKQYLCIPLCKDCHTNSKLGIHGEKSMWHIYKKTELSVLNETLDKLL